MRIFIIALPEYFGYSVPYFSVFSLLWVSIEISSSSEILSSIVFDLHYSPSKAVFIFAIVFFDS
jgi:hypothetical protein